MSFKDFLKQKEIPNGLWITCATLMMIAGILIGRFII